MVFSAFSVQICQSFSSAMLFIKLCIYGRFYRIKTAGLSGWFYNNRVVFNRVASNQSGNHSVSDRVSDQKSQLRMMKLR